MKKGTIILNHWAGEKNQSKYFIYTGIKGKYATGICLIDNKIEETTYYKDDLKDKEKFEEVGFCDYKNFIKKSLNEVKLNKKV